MAIGTVSGDAPPLRGNRCRARRYDHVDSHGRLACAADDVQQPPHSRKDRIAGASRRRDERTSGYRSGCGCRAAIGHLTAWLRPAHDEHESAGLADREWLACLILFLLSSQDKLHAPFIASPNRRHKPRPVITAGVEHQRCEPRWGNAFLQRQGV